MKIKKVPLKRLIETLISLYNKGVDYIDIHPMDDQDGVPSIGISFVEDYMSKEAKKNFDNPPISGNISEDDLNQLM